MDVKLLLDDLKGKGLDLGEDAAKLVVESVFDWVSAEALKSENKVDDLLLAVMPVVKPMIMDLLDKIDGKEG